MTTNPPSESSASATPPPAQNDTHVALLGGWRRSVDAPLPARSVCVAVVGGANFDLSKVTLPREATVLQVSLIGGIDVRVPPGTRVDVGGLRIFGRRRVEVGPADADGPLLKITSFGAVGGVHVHH